ncbi:MAG: type II secretion system protein J, partial [Candidatus Sericytochromatia bacterium]
MINIKKRKLSGFSLVEMMISVTLTIIVMTMITQFLMNFSKMSSVEGKRAELSAELRVLNLRLEKEIEQGASLLDSYLVTDTEYGAGTITSNANRIIFTRQVYNKTTYMPASSNPRDTTKNDVVIIDYTGNDGATSVQYGDVLYSLIPASATASDTNYKKSTK